jgi:Protein of unknown function (DUF3443)
MGQLVLGIGTQSNNGLGGATVIKVDGYGNFTTIFNGQTFSQSFIDSGTNQLAFPEARFLRARRALVPFLPRLAAHADGGEQGNRRHHFDGVVRRRERRDALRDEQLHGVRRPRGPGWVRHIRLGFPFFIGRVFYVGLLGATTPGGEGPFFAY